MLLRHSCKFGIVYLNCIAIWLENVATLCFYVVFFRALICNNKELLFMSLFRICRFELFLADGIGSVFSMCKDVHTCATKIEPAGVKRLISLRCNACEPCNKIHLLLSL